MIKFERGVIVKGKRISRKRDLQGKRMLISCVDRSVTVCNIALFKGGSGVSALRVA